MITNVADILFKVRKLTQAQKAPIANYLDKLRGDWTPEDDQRLRDCRRQKLKFNDTVHLLQRSQTSVLQRLQK